jgi:hypothetical protein
LAAAAVAHMPLFAFRPFSFSATSFLGRPNLPRAQLVRCTRWPKYQNITEISNYVFSSKKQIIGCIDADFYRKGAIFQHFSSSFRKYSRKRVKISEILRTKFQKIQNSETRAIF